MLKSIVNTVNAVNAVKKCENSSYDEKTYLSASKVSNHSSALPSRFINSNDNYGDSVLNFNTGSNGVKFLSFNEAKKLNNWAVENGGESHKFQTYISAFKDMTTQGKADITARELINFVALQTHDIKNSSYDEKTYLSASKVSNHSSALPSHFINSNDNYGDSVLNFNTGSNGGKFLSFNEAKKLNNWAVENGGKSHKIQTYISAFKDMTTQGKADITARELINFVALQTHDIKNDTSNVQVVSTKANTLSDFNNAKKLSWIELNEESKALVNNLQNKLLSAGIKENNIIAKKDLHITLAFFGPNIGVDILSEAPSQKIDVSAKLDRFDIFGNNLVVCSSVKNKSINQIHNNHINYAEKNGVKINVKDKQIREHITIARNLSSSDQELALSTLHLESPLLINGKVYVGYSSPNRPKDFAFMPLKGFVS